MPKQLTARPPLDAVEERYVRKLTHSVHAPADWIFHAKIVVGSWDGLRTRQIAEALSCNSQTVRERLHAFNERRVEGLGMKPGAGRKPRLSELDRSTILALVKLPAPGKPTYELTGELETPDPRGSQSGPWMRSPPRPRRAAFASRAARCAASSGRKTCARGGHACGPRARILTSLRKRHQCR